MANNRTDLDAYIKGRFSPLKVSAHLNTLQAMSIPHQVRDKPGGEFSTV